MMVASNRSIDPPGVLIKSLVALMCNVIARVKLVLYHIHILLRGTVLMFNDWESIFTLFLFFSHLCDLRFVLRLSKLIQWFVIHSRRVRVIRFFILFGFKLRLSWNCLLLLHFWSVSFGIWVRLSFNKNRTGISRFQIWLLSNWLTLIHGTLCRRCLFRCFVFFIEKCEVVWIFLLASCTGIFHQSIVSFSRKHRIRLRSFFSPG